MMMFLTLFFIFESVHILFKGRLFHKFIVENAKNEIEKAKGNKIEASTELGVRATGIGIYVLLHLVFLIIYILNALTIDPYLYPSIIFVFFILINLIIIPSKKKDLSTEEGRAIYLYRVQKKHTFKSEVVNLVYLAFYVYIFMVLVGLIK